MMGNPKKNETPCNRRTQGNNEQTWWEKIKMDLRLQNF